MGGWDGMVWWRAVAIGVCAGLLVVVGCSGDDDSADNDDGGTATTSEPNDAVVFPGEDWDEADSAELGLDPAALDAIATEAEAGGAECLLVVRDGRIAAEWYWQGSDAETAHEAFSVTKSYSSTLVGIAQDEGLLAIDDKASEYIEPWVGTPSADVTIRNILSNDTGRRSTDALGGSDPTVLANFLAAPDRTAYVVGLDQVAPPGTVWSNNEGAIQNLDPILEAATGQEPADLAREWLLDPIGAQHTEMTRDTAGNTNMPAFLQTTCRDAARLGHLFLNGGNWDGTQVVSEEWVAESIQPSQDLNPGYGYLWWLNTDGAVPDAPEDIYWALGAFGQIIQVDPGSDTVVVRFGGGDSIADVPRELTARVVTEAVAD